jgi:hypothetical protein
VIVADLLRSTRMRRRRHLAATALRPNIKPVISSKRQRRSRSNQASSRGRYDRDLAPTKLTNTRFPGSTSRSSTSQYVENWQYQSDEKLQRVSLRVTFRLIEARQNCQHACGQFMEAMHGATMPQP